MSESNVPEEVTPEEAAALDDYLAGRLSPEAHAEIEQKILASDRLANALYTDVSLRASMDELRAGAAPERRATVIPLFASRWTRVALPLAAAIAVLVLSPRFFASRHAGEDVDDEGAPHFRGGTLQAEPGVRAISPSGDVAGEPRFTWTKDPTADGYRLEILGPSGSVVFSTSTSDTSAEVPRAELEDARAVAAWRVVPRKAGADEVASAPVPLRLRDAAP